MKIFLTGGGGMVGKNLTKHPSASSYIFLTPSSNELDLRNYEKVLAFIKENKPDFIIHAAGLVGGIQANMRDPLGFLSSNLDIGRNIVMASKEAGIKNLLNLGSSCMYPRMQPILLKKSTY
ncbi:NAD-dependent epimerase/dehydratase family protein [Niabella hibiscisoli]|nr:NAD-dependent epimerase/dehydratase family protein [Niabella hibiscisoli]MCH5719962.1 NAD-dependent epimerase/dehydratase family protein [Niabella hibiscisoli]